VTIDTSGTNAQVTYEVAHDGSYTSTGNATSVVTVTVPKACLGTQPCSALTDNPSAIVTDAGSSCIVSKTSTSEIQGSGTLKNAQQNLHTTKYQYCVDGDSLVEQTIQTDGSKTRIEFKRL